MVYSFLILPASWCSRQYMWVWIVSNTPSSKNLSHSLDLTVQKKNNTLKHPKKIIKNQNRTHFPCETHHAPSILSSLSTASHFQPPPLTAIQHWSQQLPRLPPPFRHSAFSSLPHLGLFSVTLSFFFNGPGRTTSAWFFSGPGRTTCSALWSVNCRWKVFGHELHIIEFKEHSRGF